MLELLEQMEPHTYRNNHSFKNIRSSKIKISTHSHRKTFRSNIKRGGNKYVLKFVWTCKPDKIKRDQIIQDYNDGGWTTIDISSLNKVLKATWVKRKLKRDSKLSQIYKTELKQYGQTLPFKCNANPVDSNTLKFKSNFLNQILNSYYVLSYPKQHFKRNNMVEFNNTMKWENISLQ